METKNRSKLVKKLWKLNRPDMPLRSWARMNAEGYGDYYLYSLVIADWYRAKVAK